MSVLSGFSIPVNSLLEALGDTAAALIAEACSELRIAVSLQSTAQELQQIIVRRGGLTERLARSARRGSSKQCANDTKYS
jgi:hypothetical protein